MMAFAQVRAGDLEESLELDALSETWSSVPSSSSSEDEEEDEASLTTPAAARSPAHGPHTPPSVLALADNQADTARITQIQRAWRNYSSTVDELRRLVAEEEDRAEEQRRRESVRAHSSRPPPARARPWLTVPPWFLFRRSGTWLSWMSRRRVCGSRSRRRLTATRSTSAPTRCRRSRPASGSGGPRGWR